MDHVLFKVHPLLSPDRVSPPHLTLPSHLHHTTPTQADGPKPHVNGFGLKLRSSDTTKKAIVLMRRQSLIQGTATASGLCIEDNAERTRAALDAS